MRKIGLLVCLWCLSSSPLSAQTIVDANSGVAFTASADHAALAEDGITAVVDHYELLVRVQSGGALFFTQHLLKPTPDATNTITVRPISSLSTLARGVIYYAQVSAVGPGGAGVSAPSEPFLTPFQAPPVPAAPGVPVIIR